MKAINQQMLYFSTSPD